LGSPLSSVVPWSFGAEAPCVGDVSAPNLLVAVAGARAVGVARPDQAEAEPQGIAVRVAVARAFQRQRDLSALVRARSERGFEFPAHLVAVEPFARGCVRQHPLRIAPRFEREAARLRDALAARIGIRLGAVRFHDLSGLPATGQEVRGRSTALAAACRVVRARGGRVESLGRTVARIHLEQALPFGIVARARELERELRARRRVDAPGEPVWDHERLEPPLRELLK